MVESYKFHHMISEILLKWNFVFLVKVKSFSLGIAKSYIYFLKSYIYLFFKQILEDSATLPAFFFYCKFQISF